MSSATESSLTTVPPSKQIRFVNSEGQPPLKRRRVNAACRTCRKRKIRCDGERPGCLTCRENGHECLGYADADIKRAAKGMDVSRHTDFHMEYEGQPLSAGRQGTHDHRESESGTGRAEIAGHFGNPKSRKQTAGTRRGDGMTFPSGHREAAVFSDEEQGPMDRICISSTESHRVPYFRYFGPTAIVPGFKQMVVSVTRRRSAGAASLVAMSPGSGSYGGSAHGGSQSDTRSNPEMPRYDQNDPLPVNRLIVHLVETFFKHLGCNYPFLRQKSFIQRVEERSVEAILVDAVCALAARFSDHPLLTVSQKASHPKSDNGTVFSQRAKAAVVETFPRPTVAATQACLLLAYEGFGANQDSALWMYLGCAIRMAVDLGLQKLDGVKYQGQKDPVLHKTSNDEDFPDLPNMISTEEMREIELERMNTIWAVFMLDRVISSGTGRPVTLRDDDFELSFPAITASTTDGWPDPFPALIQIINLYGRVSDLLNNIRDVHDVTPKKIEGLAAMEKDLTQLYQKLDSRLNFNASNFQHYCKAGEGTNFILVHFWFHTLIMLLHQPTLMHSFEGQIISLLPNSRELSISSAKTIADILAFAELIDPRSFIGNPFTSQPIYIAACAFLEESIAQTSTPASRDISPPRGGPQKLSNKDRKAGANKTSETKQKHSLLAAAANQNYQNCYKALQQLEAYWAGTRYILVALDQKAKGIWDPETFTEQEFEDTKTKNDSVSHWNPSSSLPTTPNSRLAALIKSPRIEAGSPTNIDPSQAIWSLTGTTNSPSSNLTFLYQHNHSEQTQNSPAPSGAGNMIYDPIRSSLPESAAASTMTSALPPRYQHHSSHSSRHLSQTMAPPLTKCSTPIYSEPASHSDAEMLLGLQNSPFVQTPGSHNSFDQAHNPGASSGTQHTTPNGYDFSQNNANASTGGSTGYSGLGSGMGEWLMRSQEIDMSMLGGDMPWLEYLPQNMLDFFDNNGAASGSMNSGPNLSGD